MFKDLPRDTNYMVDENGNVFSKRRNKILSPKINRDGYLRIQIWNKNKCEFVGIHRLIAETFIPNPENKPFINHKNGDKQNNRVENLEWCTQKENIQHSLKMGLSKPSPRNWKRLSKPVDQFDLNGNYIKTFPSQIEVERQLGISHTNISYACRHNGRAGQFKWKFSGTSNDYLK